VDKSLIVAEEQQGEMRYRMLETIREYARERLEASGQAQPTRDRHLSYFMRLAEESERRLHGAEQIECLARCDVELDNLRAAVAWSLEPHDFRKLGASENLREVGARLAGGLRHYWAFRGYYGEARRAYETLLASDAGTVSPATRGKMLLGLSHTCTLQGDYIAAEQHISAALNLWRVLEDGAYLSQALWMGGWIALLRPNPTLGLARLEEGLSIAQQLHERVTEALCWLTLGDRKAYVGDLAGAHEAAANSLRLFREQGHREGMARAQLLLGNVAIFGNDYARARTHYEECFAFAQQVQLKPLLASVLQNLGETARGLNDDANAETYYAQALALVRESGHKLEVGQCLHNLGHVMLHRGDISRAATFFHESLVLYRDIQSEPHLLEGVAGMAGAAAWQHQAERAVRLFGAVDALRQTRHIHFSPLDQSDYERNLAHTRAQLNVVTFQRVWAEGQGMTMEEAVKYVLEEIGDRAIGGLRDREIERQRSGADEIEH
jgi:tetratricopeptide (TPR) repeat protein